MHRERSAHGRHTTRGSGDSWRRKAFGSIRAAAYRSIRFNGDRNGRALQRLDSVIQAALEALLRLALGFIASLRLQLFGVALRLAKSFHLQRDSIN